MEQLLCHLIGDYWLQNDWMATNKKNNFLIALLHSIIYTIPFIFITKNIIALLIICLTHAIIDGTNIVNKLNQIKNNYYVTNDGYKEERPIWLRVWLIIFQDNTLHLLINYVVLNLSLAL